MRLTLPEAQALALGLAKDAADCQRSAHYPRALRTADQIRDALAARSDADPGRVVLGAIYRLLQEVSRDHEAAVWAARKGERQVMAVEVSSAVRAILDRNPSK